MPSSIDTRDLDALSGAVYFTVGRGTEGGSASYRLSVAGVTYAEWGQVAEVAYNSGYTFGTIQIDFGQRGTWPVGSIERRSLNPGEKSYVDAVIEQASTYAQQHRLPFTGDLEKLHSDLLTHGNGQRGRASITFIDSDTRDSINAWASSEEGKRWIHKNMDLPQVRGATEQAVAIVDQHGSNIAEDTRFQAICILAKTANQAPGHLERLQSVLEDGGNYDDLLTEAKAIKANPRHSYFDGPKAAEVAEKYAAAYDDPTRKDALDRAHSKVSNPDFNPSTETNDPDIQAALGTMGLRSRTRAAKDPVVEQLQKNLNDLGIRDSRGKELQTDGHRGGPNSRTNEAIAAFQQRHGLTGQLSNAELLTATHVVLSVQQAMRPDEALRDILPENARAPQMIDGIPDYLLPGRNAPRQAPAIAQTPPTPQAPLQASPASVSHRNAALPPPAAPVERLSLPTTRTLEPGDRGGAVQALQQHLQLVGARDREGQKIRDDRDYGDRTRAAVEQFQLWTGRETTGIADPDTLKALQEHARFAVRQRAQGILQAEHLADNLKPAAPSVPDAADLLTPQDREPTQTAPATPMQPQPVALPQAQAQAQAQAPEAPAHLRDFRHAGHPRHDGYERFLQALQDKPIPGVTPDQHERIAAGLTAAQGTRRFFKEVDRFHLDKDGVLWASARPNSLISEKTRWEQIDLQATLAQTPEQAAAQWREAHMPAATRTATQAQTTAIDPQQLRPDDLRHPDHPRHGMFAQTRGLLATEYDRWGMQRDPAQLDREAAQVVVEARQQRVDGVGGITLSFPQGSTPDRPMVSLVEDPGGEFANRVTLDSDKLAQAPQVAQTSTQLQQVEQHVALMQQQEMQQRQEREQSQSQGRTV